MYLLDMKTLPSGQHEKSILFNSIKYELLNHILSALSVPIYLLLNLFLTLVTLLMLTTVSFCKFHILGGMK